MQRLHDSTHVRCVQSTPAPLSMADTFGRAQVTTHAGQVTVDLQGRHWGVDAQLYTDHGSVRLTVAQARRMRDMLDRAIETALDSSVQQPGLWSVATVNAVAARFGRAA